MRIRIAGIVLFALMLALLSGCKSGSSDNKAGDSGTSSKATLDLSTKEQAIRSIHKALKDGDKEAFRKAVSSRILEVVGSNFDSYFETWRRDAERMPVEKWLEESPKMTNEDGNWRLDER